MAEAVEGFWLNLQGDSERSTRMHAQLATLGLQARYSRFEASRGDAAHASSRGLSPGEEGAWRSWLAMLEQAERSPSPVVHLLEDDVQITPALADLLAWPLLQHHLRASHLVCTDGFVSPGQVRQLLAARPAAPGFLVIDQGLRVPCLGSVLALPAKLTAVRLALQVLWDGSEALPPIDVALGQLAAQGTVAFCTVAPFVTGPLLASARASRIREPGDACLERSREALTLLRRILMVSGEADAIATEWIGLLQAFEPEVQQEAFLDLLDGWIERGLVQPY